MSSSIRQREHAAQDASVNREVPLIPGPVPAILPAAADPPPVTSPAHTTVQSAEPGRSPDGRSNPVPAVDLSEPSVHAHAHQWSEPRSAADSLSATTSASHAPPAGHEHPLAHIEQQIASASQPLTPKQHGPSLLTQALASVRRVPNAAAASPAQQENKTPQLSQPNTRDSPSDTTRKIPDYSGDDGIPVSTSAPQRIDTHTMAPRPGGSGTVVLSPPVNANAIHVPGDSSHDVMKPKANFDDHRQKTLLDHSDALANGRIATRSKRASTSPVGSMTPPATQLALQLEAQDTLHNLRTTTASSTTQTPRKTEHRVQIGPEKIWSIGNSENCDDSSDGGQVEKSVKEAMNRSETNARSRKASHSLRFFREGLPKEERERDKGRRKEPRHGAHRDKFSPSREQPPPLPLSSDIAVEDFAKATTAAPTPRAASSQEQPIPIPLTRSKSFPAHSPEASVLGESPVLTGGEDYFGGLRKTHGQIFDSSVDARSGHSDNDEDDAASIISSSLPDSRHSDERRRKYHEDRRGSSDGTEVGESQEDGEDSGEEKISSAVFLPHQGPEESGEGDDDDQEHESRLVSRQRPSGTGRVASRNEDFHPWLVKADEPETEEDAVKRKLSEQHRSQAKDSSQASFDVVREVKLEGLPENAVEEDESEVQTPKQRKSKPEVELQQAENHHTLEHQVAAVEGEEEPREAIELIPYKHQVGGHTTLWRFSRRAVCKQLNNRENEFYESVERHHRDLLTFLPRYIGVLNVTFHKQPRRRSIHKHQEPAAAASSTAPTASTANSEQTVESLGPDANADSGVIEPAPNASYPVKSAVLSGTVPNGNEHRRIISQSLAASQISIPTVTFDDNRHILPRNLLQPTPPPPVFQRSRSTSATPCQDKRLHSPTHNDERRPSLDDRHANSWGATTVNKRLRNEVFNDAFLKQPIPVHRHRRPHQRAIPLRSYQSVRPATSDGVTGQANIPADKSHHGSNLVNELHAISEPQQQQEQQQQQKQPPQGIQSEHLDFQPDESKTRPVQVAKSNQEDTEFGTMTGTSAPEPTNLVDQMVAEKKKRRYSGSMLRRKPRDVTESRGHLQYWEEADDARNDNDSDNNRDHLDRPGKGSVVELSLTDDKGKAHQVAMELGSKTTEQPAPKNHDEISASAEESPATALVSTSPSEEFRKIPRPINPKEAQTQTQRDSRVDYFLLLEDLTAGMKRPCIMDLKMGTRQYGVEATPKKQKSQQGKCARTTSRELGVRVCGLQVWDVRTQSYVFKDKYFGRDLRAGREFQDALVRFLYDGLDLASILRHIPTVLAKLDRLESIVRGLDGYRFYAASLLMFYDGDQSSDADEYDTAVDDSTTDAATDTEEAMRERKSRKKSKRDIDFKIADFANSLTKGDLAEGKPCPPQHPNQADWGFIMGLRTLRLYFLKIQREIRADLGLIGAARGQSNEMEYEMEPIDEGLISE